MASSKRIAAVGAEDSGGHRIARFCCRARGNGEQRRSDAGRAQRPGGRKATEPRRYEGERRSQNPERQRAGRAALRMKPNIPVFPSLA
jgi:hypothetical protein